MSTRLKVSFIGARSAVFTKNLVFDLLSYMELSSAWEILSAQVVYLEG